VAPGGGKRRWAPADVVVSIPKDV